MNTEQMPPSLWQRPRGREHCRVGIVDYLRLTYTWPIPIDPTTIRCPGPVLDWPREDQWSKRRRREPMNLKLFAASMIALFGVLLIVSVKAPAPTAATVQPGQNCVRCILRPT